MAESRLVWIDLEMTGLYPDENTIIEIATIVTETDLSIVAEGPSFAIDVGKEELAKMDDWNVKHHTENGLLARIESEGVSMQKAELETLEFLQQHCSPRAVSIMWEHYRTRPTILTQIYARITRLFPLSKRRCD